MTIQIETHPPLVRDAQLSTELHQLITEGKHFSFALLTAMFSRDVREIIPRERKITPKRQTNLLSPNLEITSSPARLATLSDYKNANIESHLFQQSSIVSTRLQQHLLPPPLHFSYLKKHQIPEELFHNLSHHQQRQLNDANHSFYVDDIDNLYNQLVKSKIKT